PISQEEDVTKRFLDIEGKDFFGSAFQVEPDGEIHEIPKIQFAFKEGGVFECNLKSALGEERNARYPSDRGHYRLLPGGGLYLSDIWPQDRIQVQGVCDVYYRGGVLAFTSIRRDVYFVLTEGK
ncbi:MAG: hypothetical protein KC978_21705, partial [Candidatus Omnitrophica bacterium]|nr:hypothetical protein [Candidatus Omnitrophota bacterium]